MQTFHIHGSITFADLRIFTITWAMSMTFGAYLVAESTDDFGAIRSDSPWFPDWSVKGRSNNAFQTKGTTIKLNNFKVVSMN